MPRLIILLLTVAALSILTLQNLARESAVPLVVMGQTVAESFPLGLLLLISVAIGSLLTLILYGLVGLQRPPESKYRPMGRRVPYPPDSPGSTTLPASGPSSDYTPQPAYGDRYSSSSSAFVTEPNVTEPDINKPAGKPDSAPGSTPDPASKPFITPPQDTPPQDRSPRDSAAFQPDSADSSSSYFSQEPASEPSSSDLRSRSFAQKPLAGLKSTLGLGKKKDRKPTSDEPAKPIGDDWGQLRTTAQRNSWEVNKNDSSRLEEGAKSLFNFGRNVGANAGRLAEDIASGWNNQGQSGQGQSVQGRSDERYVDRYESAGYESAGYESYVGDDSLDRGWENFDDYSDPPPDYRSSDYQASDRRTYGDSLYGSTVEGGPEGPYPYDDERLNELGPDGVYEADYRVIEPPSKPLTEPLTETDELDDDTRQR
ncbi:MAG: hypothetical protein ACFB16_13265 [Phormidesmis sp.]